MSRLIRTTSLYRFTPDMDQPGAGGGGANPLDELPEEVRAKVSEHFVPKSLLATDYLPRTAVEKDYVTKDVLNGAKGGLQGQINDLTTKLATANTERQSYFDQHTALSTEHGALKEKWTAAEPQLQTLGTVQAELTGLKAKTARQELMLRYPTALDAATAALVASSNLDDAALEAYLKGMAEQVEKTGKRTGAIPPLPQKKTDGPTSSELFDKADGFRRAGKIPEYREAMDLYYAKKDEEDGKFVPPHATRKEAAAE